MNKCHLINITFTLLALGCGSGTDGGTGDDSNGNMTGETCRTSEDCGEEHVCLSSYGESACAPICTGNATECTGNASCGGVGVLSVNVCKEPEPEPSPQDPPEPEEQPRIPCASDAECAAAASGAICAEFRGQRDCTIACTAESQCDIPSLGGPKLDFYTCIPDEGDSSRSACLPDARCFDDPLSCITGLNCFPGAPGC